MKPSGGGGGMGMQVVEQMDALESALTQAQTVAAAAFGNGDVYLERWIAQPRHISIRFWRMSMATPCTCMSANVRFSVVIKN